MNPEDMTPVDLDVAGVWTLSEDRTTVRLKLAPLPLEGLPRALEHLDFDIEAEQNVRVKSASDKSAIVQTWNVRRDNVFVCQADGGLQMKRVALAGLLFAAAGTASATMIVPLPAPEPPRAKPAKIAVPAAASSPSTIETRRPPVPYMPTPRPAIAPVDPVSPELSQVLPRSPTNTAKRAIEQDPNKFVRDLTSNDGQCKGRSLESVTVEPNGNVRVKC